MDDIKRQVLILQNTLSDIAKKLEKTLSPSEISMLCLDIVSARQKLKKINAVLNKKLKCGADVPKRVSNVISPNFIKSKKVYI